MHTVFTLLCLLLGIFVTQASTICDYTGSVSLDSTNAQQYENCTYFKGFFSIGWPVPLGNYGTNELRYLSQMTSISVLDLYQKLNLTAFNNLASLTTLDLEGDFEPVGPDFFPKLNGTGVGVGTNGTDFSYFRNMVFISSLTIETQVDLSYFSHMRFLPGVSYTELGFGNVNYTAAQLALLVPLGPPHSINLNSYLGTSFNTSIFYPHGVCPGINGLVGVDFSIYGCVNLVDFYISCPTILRMDITGPMDNLLPEGIHFKAPIYFDNLYVTSMKWTNMYALNGTAGATYMDLVLQEMPYLTHFGITQNYWNDLTIENMPMLNALPELAGVTYIDSYLNFYNVNLTVLDMPAVTYIERFEIQNMPNLRLINAPILSHTIQVEFVNDPLLSNLTMCQLCQFSQGSGTISASLQNVPLLSCSGLTTLYQQWIGSVPTSQVSGCDNINANTYCACQIPSSSSTRRYSSSALLSSSAAAGAGASGGDSSTADNNDGSSDDTNKKIAELVILIVVILVVIGIIAGCVVYCRRRAKHSSDHSNMTKMDDIATHTNTL